MLVRTMGSEQLLQSHRRAQHMADCESCACPCSSSCEVDWDAAALLLDRCCRVPFPGGSQPIVLSAGLPFALQGAGLWLAAAGPRGGALAAVLALGAVLVGAHRRAMRQRPRGRTLFLWRWFLSTILWEGLLFVCLVAPHIAPWRVLLQHWLATCADDDDSLLLWKAVAAQGPACQPHLYQCSVRSSRQSEQSKDIPT